MSELTESLEEVETAIRRYSEELIQALALRDELDYEKEVLDIFISVQWLCGEPSSAESEVSRLLTIFREYSNASS